MSISNIPHTAIFARFADQTTQTEISGVISSTETALKTLVAQRRSDGTLIGTTLWDSGTGVYELFMPYMGTGNVTIECRDEGGTYDGLVHDIITQGNHTYTVDNNIYDGALLLSNPLLNYNFNLLASYSVLATPNTTTFENVQGTIANLVLLDGGYKCKLTNSGGTTIPITKVGMVNGVRIEKVNGDDVYLGYNGCDFLSMSTNPFSDASQIWGYTFNNTGVDVNGSYNIPIVNYPFKKFATGNRGGIGINNALALETVNSCQVLPYRVATNTAFSISFKFAGSLIGSEESYRSIITQHDAFAISYYSATMYVANCNNGTWSTARRCTSVAITVTSIPYTIVMTYDGAGALKLYVDGVLAGTFTGATILPSDTTKYISLTRNNLYTSGGKGGCFVSHLRFFNRVLTLAETGTLMNDTPVLGTTPVTSLYQSEIHPVTNKLKLAGANGMFDPVAKFKFPGYIGEESNTFPTLFFSGVAVPKDSVAFDGTLGCLWRGDARGTEVNANAIDETDVSAYVRFKINPIIFDSSHVSLIVSNNKKTFLSTVGSIHLPARSLVGVTSGKWYWEIKVDFSLSSGSSNMFVGVATIGSGFTTYPGSNTTSWGCYALQGNKYLNSSSTAYGVAWGNGDVMGICLDMTNNKLYFAKNNVWMNSGDPVAGTGYAWNTGFSGQTIVPAASAYNANDKFTTRFSASEQTYSPPTGFTALNDITAIIQSIKCLWKSGNITDGFGVGFNASGNLLVSALSGGTQTSSTVSTAGLVPGDWYKVYADDAHIALYTDANTLVAETTGLTLTAANSTGKESVGGSILGSVLSKTAGDGEYFKGSISDVTITKQSDSSVLFDYKFGATRNGVEIFNYYLYHTHGPDRRYRTNKSILLDGTNTASHMLQANVDFPNRTFTGSYTFSMVFQADLTTNIRGLCGPYIAGAGVTVYLLASLLYFCYNGTTAILSISNTVDNYAFGTKHWWHFVYVNDKPNNTLKVYLNKNLIYSGVAIVQSTYSQPISIGNMGSAYYNHAGLIDNCFFLDYAVNSSQLQYIFDQVDYTGIYGVYSTTIFDTINANAEIILGEALDTINVIDNEDTQKIAYCLSFDRLTYRHYVSSTWVSIASKDPAVHGNGGDNRWYYLNGSAVWVLSTIDAAPNALSKAIELSASYMNSASLNALTTSNFTAGGYLTTSGICAISATLYSSSFYNPEVTTIAINNMSVKLSEVIPLDPYNSIITTSRIDFANIKDITGYTVTDILKAYVFVTGTSGWVEYTPGSTIPGITAGMTTTGKNLQVKTCWDLGISSVLTNVVKRAYKWYGDVYTGILCNLEDTFLANYVQQFSYLCGDYTTAFSLNTFKISVNSLAALNDAKSYSKLQGSNDTTNGSDGTWTDIQSFASLATPSAYPGWCGTGFTYVGLTAYRFYRIYCSTPSASTIFNEWELSINEYRQTPAITPQDTMVKVLIS